MRNNWPSVNKIYNTEQSLDTGQLILAISLYKKKSLVSY